MEFDATVQSLRKELAACAQSGNASDIPWSWVATALSRILADHSSGASRTVVLAELEVQWYNIASSDLVEAETNRSLAPFFDRTREPLPTWVFNLKIDDMLAIPGTDIWLWKVSGAPAPLNPMGSAAEQPRGKPSEQLLADKRADAFIHQRYYPMIEAHEFSGFFSRMRTLLATNLMMTDRGGGEAGHPVRTLLPTAALAFVIRIKDDPALPDVLRQNTDELLLRNLFGVSYRSGRFVKCADPLFNADQLWCRVEEICEPSTEIKDGKPTLHQLISCILEHENPSTKVDISLWENDVALARLIKPDYYIGLLCPVIRRSSSDEAFHSSRGAMAVEYGPQTIAFVMHSIRHQANALTSQLSIARNEAGYLDYRQYAHQVQLCQCCRDMIHLTVIARIVAVSDNMPYTDSSGSTDRYAVRIDDGTATLDMTLWGELGRQASSMLPGQLVVWNGIETDEENGDVVLNGSAEAGAAFYNISRMTGILMSSSIRDYTFLAHLPNPANRYAKVCVMDLAPASQHIRDARDHISATMLVHASCMRRVICSDSPHLAERLENPTDLYEFDCPSCGVLGLDIDDVSSVFSVSATIDDGTASITAHVAAEAASDMLLTSAAQFLALAGTAEQRDILTKPLGREFVVSITAYCEPLSTEREVRVDAICSSDYVSIPPL
ncbi:hypothetical protein GGF46_001563 [Coemansia sp. RSA 552]|nr:hypothetical protein GGF46_001563 [Coemansia sp. RSA 552]